MIRGAVSPGQPCERASRFRRLSPRSRRLTAIASLSLGLVAVDFYRRGDVVAVANTLNGVG